MVSIGWQSVKGFYICILAIVCFLHGVSGSISWLSSEILNLISDLLVIVPLVIFSVLKRSWSMQLASTVLFGGYIGLLALISISPLDAFNEGKYFVFFMMLSCMINTLNLSEDDLRPIFILIMVLVVSCGVIIFLDPEIIISRFGFAILPGYGTTGYIGLSGLCTCAYLILKGNKSLGSLCAIVALLSLLLIIFSGARRYLILLALGLLLYYPIAVLMFWKVNKASIRFWVVSAVLVTGGLYFSGIAIYLSPMLEGGGGGFSNIDLIGGTGRFASEDGSFSEGVLAQRLVQAIENPFGVSLGNVSNDLTGVGTTDVLMDGSVNRIFYSTGIVGFLLLSTFIFHTFKPLNVFALYKSAGTDRFLAVVFILYPLLFLVEDVYFIKSGSLTLFLFLRVAVLRSQSVVRG